MCGQQAAVRRWLTRLSECGPANVQHAHGIRPSPGSEGGGAAPQRLHVATDEVCSPPLLPTQSAGLQPSAGSSGNHCISAAARSEDAAHAQHAAAMAGPSHTVQDQPGHSTFQPDGDEHSVPEAHFALSAERPLKAVFHHLQLSLHVQHGRSYKELQQTIGGLTQ